MAFLALTKKIALSLISEQGLDVIIPRGVYAEIDEYAFANTGLESVVLPDGVTKIGDDAFGNNQLTSVESPDRVTCIGNKVFDRNPNLQSILAPKDD